MNFKLHFCCVSSLNIIISSYMRLEKLCIDIINQKEKNINIFPKEMKSKAKVKFI